MPNNHEATTTIPYKDYLALIVERDRLREALTGTLAALMQATIEDELTDSKISRWNAAVEQAEAALNGGGDE